MFCYRDRNGMGGWIWEKKRGIDGVLISLPVSWPAQKVCQQGMPAGVGGWNNDMSRRQVDHRKCLLSLRNMVRNERETLTGFLLHS